MDIIGVDHGKMETWVESKWDRLKRIKFSIVGKKNGGNGRGAAARQKRVAKRNKNIRARSSKRA